MTLRRGCCLRLLVLSVLCTTHLAAGPPFKTDDPEPVDYRHWELYVASQQQFDSHTTSATLPHFEINYGVVPGVQLHVVAPLGYVRADGVSHYGYSDTELGVKYRFLEETDNAPQVGVFPLVEIPTGSETDQLGAGNVQAYLPLWIQKSWGKLTAYGGGGYWHTFKSGQRNWFFAGGEAQNELSALLTLGAEVYYQSPAASDADPVTGCNVGGFLNLTEHHHILFSLGRTAASAAVVTGYIGYQFTI